MVNVPWCHDCDNPLGICECTKNALRDDIFAIDIQPKLTDQQRREIVDSLIRKGWRK